MELSGLEANIAVAVSITTTILLFIAGFVVLYCRKKQAKEEKNKIDFLGELSKIVQLKKEKEKEFFENSESKALGELNHQIHKGYKSGVLGEMSYNSSLRALPQLPSRDEKEEKITYWSIEREKPVEAYDASRNRMMKISGVLEELAASNYPANKIVEHVKKTYGGGEYVLYACNYKGEQLSNRPVSIPLIYPPLDGTGRELVLEAPEPKPISLPSIPPFKMPSRPEEKSETLRQWWHEKTILAGACGDIVFFRNLDSNVRVSNMEATGQISTRGPSTIKKIILKFPSTDCKEDISKLFDMVIVRLHIEGDDTYRFVRPTKFENNEAIYEFGEIKLGAGQAFSVIFHLSDCLKTKNDLTPTVILETVAAGSDLSVTSFETAFGSGDSYTGGLPKGVDLISNLNSIPDFRR